MKIKNVYAVLAGKMIKELRKRRGYSVVELAEKIGCKNVQKLYRYERGVYKIDIDTLVMCLKVLEMDIDEFFTEMIYRAELAN